MTAVGDLGAVLRWVGLLPGPSLLLRRLVSADALLALVVDYLRVRLDDRTGPVTASLIEIQLAVHEWYPTWPVSGRVVSLATVGPSDIDATLLVPVAVGAETGLPFATASTELAELARPHVSSVLLV